MAGVVEVARGRHRVQRLKRAEQGKPWLPRDTLCGKPQPWSLEGSYGMYMYTWNNLYLFPLIILLDMHNISLAMQETHLERPCSDYEVWERMKQKRPDLSLPQPSLPEFYGTAKEDGANYLEAFTGFHPEAEDPRAEEIDERAVVVAGRGREHGRLKILDMVLPRTPAFCQTPVKGNHKAA
jgi:hypothetical protein